jgi:hypothetical protein
MLTAAHVTMMTTKSAAAEFETKDGASSQCAVGMILKTVLCLHVRKFVCLLIAHRAYGSPWNTQGYSSVTG